MMAWIQVETRNLEELLTVVHDSTNKQTYLSMAAQRGCVIWRFQMFI
jgi:hypothetical protein